METIQIEAKISHRGIQKVVRFAMTGSQTYTVLPKAIWLKLKLAPQRQHATVTGTPGLRLSECLIEIARKSYSTIAVLGEKNDQPRLGIMVPANRSRLGRDIERRLRQR